MIQQKDDSVARFSVEVEVANNDDLVLARAGQLSEEQVRRTTIRAVVDIGATRLVIPLDVADSLGLQVSARAGVRYADGRQAERDVAHGLHLTYGGRSSVFNAIIEPDPRSALLGAIVLEDLDFVVDCTHQRLVPRDPRYIFSEIE